MRNLLAALTVLKILGYWNYSWWWILTPCLLRILIFAIERECPFCFESIKYKATKCKHCHSILDKNK